MTAIAIRLLRAAGAACLVLIASAGFAAESKGVNGSHRIRRPAPLDQRTALRMNRDTPYPVAIAGTGEDGAITLPPSADGRHVSVQFIDNDHYDPGVIPTPGAHALPKRNGHVAAAVRIQFLTAWGRLRMTIARHWQTGLAREAGGRVGDGGDLSHTRRPFA